MSLLAPIRAVPFAMLLALGLMFTAPAQAGGVINCENCSNSKQAAISTGIGLTVVVDVSGKKLLAYDVEYDRELHRYRALPVQVPVEVRATFDRLLRMLEAERNAHRTEAAQPRGRSVVVPVSPDDLSNTNGITFPDAFKSLTASDVVVSANHRAGLESAIGIAFSGADTRFPVWNALSTTMTSIVMSVGGKLAGIDSYTYVITWRDGSVTRLVVTADSVDVARYQSGQSRDPQGNLIPDGAATSPTTAPGFAGVYTFTDEQTLNNWLNAAYIYGVPVEVVEHTLPVSIVCRWNGRTLECEVPR